MTEYLRDKDLTFRLKDLGEFEELTVWKAFNIKEDVLGQDGMPLKFPIKDGELIGIDGIVRKVDTLSNLPPSAFKTLYPKMSLKKTFTRTIFVQNIEFWYRFSKSSNDKLKKLIMSIGQLGQNPLMVNFRQVYNKNAKTPGEYYDIVIENTITSPMPTIPQGRPMGTPVPTLSGQYGGNLDTVAAQTFQLNEQENLVYNTVIKIPLKQPLENFINIFSSNGITNKERITSIYNMKYAKEKQ